MSCIKTGCHAYIEPYGLWAYGDAFAFEVGDGEPFHSNVYYFRFVEISARPTGEIKHFTINNYNSWFDEHAKISTMICNGGVLNHGYDGIPI